jgi:hypothetical protein
LNPADQGPILRERALSQRETGTLGYAARARGKERIAMSSPVKERIEDLLERNRRLIEESDAERDLRREQQRRAQQSLRRAQQLIRRAGRAAG